MRAPRIIAVAVAALVACQAFGLETEPAEEPDPGLDASVMDANTKPKDTGANDSTSDVAIIDSGPCGACTSVAHRLCTPTRECVDAFRVFVSSTGSTAKLGGVAGADATCQALADAAKLGGTFKAWVSVSTGTSPTTRFTQGTVPYRLLNGTVIADNFDGVTSGALKAKINLDEKLQDVGATEVWTGTDENGNAFGTGCNGFTDEDKDTQPVTVGVTTATNGAWSNVYLQECNRTTQRLYCFEQ